MNPARAFADSLPREAVPGLRPGGSFGTFTLLDELGRGAMGVVFSAMQSGSNRVVAIKFAHGSLAGSAEAMRRFRTEAEAVAALDHPGILPIYEVGEIEGTPYYTMRFAEAGSLAERLDWFADPRAAAALVAAIAEAVQHAHARGILHRDLKPGNILLATRAEPLVGDFGLARWAQRESDLTASLTVLGTPDYLAPEMLRGARVGSTTACDVFSLGAILYHLLAGRPPFAGTSVTDVLSRVEQCAPPPLSNAPRDLAAVCMKALEREPAARYASADALAADLRAWLAGQPVIARPVGPAGRFARWVRRKPALAGLVISFVAAVIALVVNIAASRGAALAFEKQRTEIAERFASEQHRAALLTRAQLRLSTRDSDRREDTLRLLGEAWKLGPSSEIRSAAITALALPAPMEATPPGDVIFTDPDPAPELTATLPTRVLRIAFDRAGKRIAAAGADKLIYLLDADGHTIARRLRGHEGDCVALSFSPDGHWLAAASNDQRLRIWEVRDGRELLVFDTLNAAHLRWSQDGAWLSVAPDRALHFLRATVATFFIPETEQTRAEETVTIDMSGDGRWLVTVDENGTRLWETRTQRQIALFAKTGPEWSAARFSPDSQRLWIGGWNSALRVVPMPPAKAPAHVAEFAGALIDDTADGAWMIAVSNDSGGFQFVATSPPHRDLWLAHPHPMSVAVTRDARRAATSSFDAPGVRVWDLPSGKMLREIPAAPTANLAFTADGALLATGSAQTVQLWNATTGERGLAIPVGARINALAFSPDGRVLAVETRRDIRLFRASEPFDQLAHLTTAPDRGTASFRFSRDAHQLAVQTATGGAIVWHLDALERELRALGMAWDQPLADALRP